MDTIVFGVIMILMLTIGVFICKKQKENCDKKIENQKIIANAKVEEYRQKMYCLYSKINEKENVIAELRKELNAVKRNSCIDPLTGLHNRKYLNENAQKEVDRAERDNKPMTFLFIDLDNFKKCNDAWGHQMGDDILRKVAEKIKAVSRSSDTYVRLGGDEFFMILPGMEEKETQNFLVRLEQEISSIPEELGIYCPDFSASVGSVKHIPGTSFEESMNQADRRMYSKKMANNVGMTGGLMSRVKDRRKKR